MRDVCGIGSCSRLRPFDPRALCLQFNGDIALFRLRGGPLSAYDETLSCVRRLDPTPPSGVLIHMVFDKSKLQSTGVQRWFADACVSDNTPAVLEGSPQWVPCWADESDRTGSGTAAEAKADTPAENASATAPTAWAREYARSCVDGGTVNAARAAVAVLAHLGRLLDDSDGVAMAEAEEQLGFTVRVMLQQRALVSSRADRACTHTCLNTQVVPPATCLAPHVLTFTLLHSLIQHLYDSFVAPYYAAFGGGEGHPATSSDVATLSRAARIGAHGIAFALRVLHENLQHSEREPGIRYMPLSTLAWRGCSFALCLTSWCPHFLF